MDFADLPADLRKPEQKASLWFWSKRGDVIELVSEKRAKDLIREGRLWRRVTAAEIQEGVKPGFYNPVYDIGEGGIKPVILSDMKETSEIGDELVCIEV